MPVRTPLPAPSAIRREFVESIFARQIHENGKPRNVALQDFLDMWKSVAADDARILRTVDNVLVTRRLDGHAMESDFSAQDVLQEIRVAMADGQAPGLTAVGQLSLF